MIHANSNDFQVYSILRKRYGRGFQYFDTEQVKKIQAPKTISRIKAMVIPPMWSEVRISKLPDVHLLAYGYDAKARRQYIYHEEWNKKQQLKKFKKLKKFGEALPAMRKFCLAQMQEKTWTKDKVLALIILVLDHCGMRIGNRQYTNSNNTYGLTTLRRKHIGLIEEDILMFDYTGKSNKHRTVAIDDTDLVQWIAECASTPGYEIFRYQQDGILHNIDSSDVNEFIRHHMGKNFSCKDFRTWVGSRSAIELYPKAVEIKKEFPRKKIDTVLLKEVANELGNTLSVTRDYYVHPKIMNLVVKEKLPILKPIEHSVYSYKHDRAEICLLEII